MCLSPINIKNPTKFISTKHSQKLFLSVPCGRCAECQTSNQNAYYLRILYQFIETVRKHGYMLFDCLTYDEEHLPRISDFINTSVDYPCFSYSDVRYFIVRLRRKLEYAGYNVSDNLRYFVASEYGDLKGRPHYHLLFFVFNNFISPTELSNYISECWKLGRTDGVRFRGSYYVNNRCVIKSDIQGLEYTASSLRVCRYVAKYVCKDSKYSNEINKRISEALKDFYLSETQRFQFASFDDDFNPTVSRILDNDDEYGKWLKTSTARALKRKLNRCVGQNHYQSLHFGEELLHDIDLVDLFEHGSILLPSSDKIKVRVPLPLYYQRKLFYERVKYNGAVYWQLNDLGIEYLKARNPHVLSCFRDKLQSMSYATNIPIPDLDKLSDYYVNTRGRAVFGGVKYCRIEDIANLEDSEILYNYSHSSDIQRFGVSFLSRQYVGCSQTGYSCAVPVVIDYLDRSVRSYLGSVVDILPSDYLLSISVFDNDMEILLDRLFVGYRAYRNKQALFDRLQELDKKKGVFTPPF